MKDKSKIILSIVAVCAVFFLFAYSNFAQAALVNCGGYQANGSPQNPCKLYDIVISIQNIINFLLSAAWLVAVLFIMWSGWGFLNAAGNQEKIGEAKKTFSNAVIGFFLVMAVYLLLNAIVGNLTGKPATGLPTDILPDYFNLLK
jgi:ABC-type Fe3+ transport system permease subunit